MSNARTGLLALSASLFLACETPHAPPAPYTLEDSGAGRPNIPSFFGASTGGGNSANSPSASDGPIVASGELTAVQRQLVDACSKLDPDKVYMVGEAFSGLWGVYDFDNLDLPCFAPGLISAGRSIQFLKRQDKFLVVEPALILPVWDGESWSKLSPVVASKEKLLLDVGAQCYTTSLLYLWPGGERFFVECGGTLYGSDGSKRTFDLPIIATGRDDSLLVIDNDELAIYVGGTKKSSSLPPIGTGSLIAARSTSGGFLVAMAAEDDSIGSDRLFYVPYTGGFEERGAYPPWSQPQSFQLGTRSVLSADGTLYDTPVTLGAAGILVVRRKLRASKDETMFRYEGTPKEKAAGLPPTNVLYLVSGP